MTLLSRCYHRRVKSGDVSVRLIPAIVGPTASGKSEMGLQIALSLSGEIVNLDSVQVYRGIYVATAKVPLAERRGVPHHLIDIAEPAENFTAGEYARVAARTITEIETRKHTAVLVGGTGFYLRALMNPLFEGPETNAALRDRLIALRDSRGAEHLHQILKRVDAQAAKTISPRDWARTMRALEVYFQTGRRMSEVRTDAPPAPELAQRIRVVALNPPRDELYSRINARAERMFAGGLIEEVESLIATGVPESAKAFGAHGYRRVVEYLKGKRSREDALNQMKLDTRHYAKRQLSWWRSWPGVKWINGFGDEAGAFEEAIEYLRTSAGGDPALG
ncbi:MAG TPA: tRNA (adenosine(37)-N6)-dimethylallyltransferase MiaA [Blastocatellia bacterium]|nr:tRNA (adenosine(37)-N6)-dimethylallyltransferase MiaA [Blastocatellia bacterium]